MSWPRRGTLSLLLFVATCSVGIRVDGQATSSETPAARTYSAVPATASPGAINTLDFEFFKTRVEPIFLKERAGHAPCYGCHILANRAFHLQALSAGSTTWTDEQSRL